MLVGDIFRWVVDVGAAGTALLGLAYGVMLLLKQPAKRVRVAEAALVGCLLLAVVQAVPATRISLGVVEVGAPVRLPWFDELPAVNAREAGAREGTVANTVGSAATTRTGGRVSFVYWREVVLSLYAVGVLTMTARLVLGWMGLRRLVKRGQVAGGKLAECWDGLRQGRRVTLLVSEQVSRPITFGIYRAIVVLPAELVEAPERDVVAVLRHELGHVERRDALAWLLAAMVNIGMFFVPTLWSVKREMRLAQEFLADRAGVEAFGGEAGTVAYAEMMVRLVGARQGGGRMQGDLAMGAWTGRSDLLLRVKHLFHVKDILDRGCTKRWTLVVAFAVLLVTGGLGAVTLADTSVKSQVRAAELKGVAYLLSRQEPGGGWLTEMGPAPTALVVRSLLQAGVPAEHAAVVRAREFVAKCRRSDGGYYTDGEPTYQTAVVMSMYAALGDADAKERVEEGREFLRREVERPKKKAGDWYAAEEGHVAEAKAAFADPRERAADAILETYGSLTYTKWKSLVYAGLKDTDPRVKQAAKWLGEHWTLEKHPGTGSAEGLYYYYLAAARTLKAAGMEKVGGQEWRETLGRRLVKQQSADGSWVNGGSGRWLEDRREMVTAYALLALQETR